jgi:hypothetical protein
MKKIEQLPNFTRQVKLGENRLTKSTPRQYSEDSQRTFTNNIRMFPKYALECSNLHLNVRRTFSECLP